MEVLGLPGRDEATVAWLRQVLDGLGYAPDRSLIQRYGCWDDTSDFDLDAEVAKAGAVSADLVIAKSMGTRVAIHGAARGVLTAPSWVLIGIPLTAYDSSEVELLRALCDAGRVLVVQQTDDFLGGYAAVAALLETTAATLAEVPGSDHVYSDTDALSGLIAAWR